MSKPLFYTVNGITGTVKDFAVMAGISIEAMRKRLLRYVEGKFPADKILSDAKEISRNGSGNDEWSALSNQERKERLARIPGPAPFDR